jgi:hypothetical protein
VVSVASLTAALCLFAALLAITSQADARGRHADRKMAHFHASPSARTPQRATIDVRRSRSRARASQAADVLFGTFNGDDPYNGNVDATNALERRLDRRIDIVNWYQNWSGDDWIKAVHPEVFGAVTGSGRKPMLTWMPSDGRNGGKDQPAYRLERIANGAMDDYIEWFASDLRDLKTTVYLRPMHEFNGDWYSWGYGVNGNTPDDFVAAWRRMHDIFERVGADNVRWVWCANAESVPDTRANRIENYYPGRKYVDVLSLDGYNWGSTRPDMGGYRSFRKIFREPYERLQALGNQPIWLAEVGTAPEGGDKAQWVRNMFATARRWKQLRAIVWFDQDKERDWRAAPNDVVAAAFSD